MSEKSKHKIDASVVICAILCVVLLALCIVGVIFGVRDGVPVVAYADDELYGEIVYHPNLLPEYNYGFGINLTLDSSYPKQANLVHGDTVYFSLQRAQYGYATIDGVITEGHTQFLVHKSSGTTAASQRPQLYIIFPVTVELETLYTYYCDVYNGSGTVVFGFCNYDFDTNTVTASTGTSVAIVSSAPVVTRTSSSTQYSYFYIALTSSSTAGSESYLTTNYMKLEEGVFYSGREPLSSGEIYNQGYNVGYSDGLNAYDTSRYNLLDTFNKDGFITANGAFYTQFSYDGRDYDTGVSASWTTVNSSSYSMARLVPAQAGKYVGIKYVNNLLFGDIVLQFAMSTNPNFPAVFHFVDTVTGDTLIVSSGDTVNFKYIGDVGYAYNANGDIIDTAYMAEIRVSFVNPVDLYILPSQPIASSGSGGNIEYWLDYPLSGTNTYIYASGDSSLAYDYDSGYKAGYKKASENQDALIRNAEDAGYHRGRSERYAGCI